jgi:hypothetical protein
VKPAIDKMFLQLSAWTPAGLARNIFTTLKKKKYDHYTWWIAQNVHLQGFKG